MAQTRRTVSVSRALGERLGTYCTKHGIPHSAFVEYLLDNQDAPQLGLDGFLEWHKRFLADAESRRQLARRRKRSARKTA